MNLRPLRVFQLNVARSNVRMHAILNTLTDFDIIFIQEPWYGRIGIARSSTDQHGIDIKGTVANPAWELFIPNATADGPPVLPPLYERASNCYMLVHAQTLLNQRILSLLV